jgi:hypothetical protein
MEIAWKPPKIEPASVSSLFALKRSRRRWGGWLAASVIDGNSNPQISSSLASGVRRQGGSGMNDPDKIDRSDSGGSRRPAIAGLVIAVVLLVVGLWLARELTAASKMQDCLMSGRTNCNVIPAQ